MKKKEKWGKKNMMRKKKKRNPFVDRFTIIIMITITNDNKEERNERV